MNLIRGERADAAAARDDSNFTARLSASERAAFNAATPNRFAFKHAHSQQNPEKDWGQQRAALDQVRVRTAQREVRRHAASRSTSTTRS